MTTLETRLIRSSKQSRPRRWFLVVALALGGCSALPVITPDLSRPDPQGVQFQAASGRILSPERSRERVAQLGNGGEGADVLARHIALGRAVADNPLVLGNRVVILENGPTTFASMLDAIASARDSINMETYILEDDEVGRQFADALIAKQALGVQVNLIHDGVGTLGTPKAYFERLTAAGINVLEFNPVNPLAAKAGWDVNRRDHRKLLVVDGRSAVMGGINISSVYSSGSAGGFGTGGGSRSGDKKTGLPWRDTDLLLEGPVVAPLQKLFMETWAGQKGAP